jgi:hypothetical protein
MTWSLRIAGRELLEPLRGLIENYREERNRKREAARLETLSRVTLPVLVIQVSSAPLSGDTRSFEVRDLDILLSRINVSSIGKMPANKNLIYTDEVDGAYKEISVPACALTLYPDPTGTDSYVRSFNMQPIYTTERPEMLPNGAMIILLSEDETRERIALANQALAAAYSSPLSTPQGPTPRPA